MTIFICTDDGKLRPHLETAVKNNILLNRFEANLGLSTASPFDLLHYLKAQAPKKSKALYFLDADMQNEMSGIILASKIREQDVYGKIVLLSIYAKLINSTFAHNIEAMDYIVKQEVKNITYQIERCIELAHRRLYN